MMARLLRNLLVVAVASFLLLQCYLAYIRGRCESRKPTPPPIRWDIADNSSVLYNLHKIAKSPVIFIGGYARSGTTLMRAILDVHDSVVCVLKFQLDYKNNQANIPEIINSGLSQEKLDNAMRLYVYYIMNEHIRPAERLCAKDPNILYFISYLSTLFTNAKFVYLVRNPRAVVHSLLGLYEEAFTMSNARKYFITWQQYNMKVKRDCDQIGPSRCLMVKYEELILNPKETISQVATFLNLKWTDNFLKHEEFIDNGKVKVSNIEWSSDQIKKAIYRDSLVSWAGKINYDEEIIKFRCPLAYELGYGENASFTPS